MFCLGFFLNNSLESFLKVQFVRLISLNLIFKQLTDFIWVLAVFVYETEQQAQLLQDTLNAG